MSTELGKLMPSAVDLEEMVLGAILLEKDALYEVMPILTAKCFYNDDNRLLYGAIVSMFEKSLPIDIATITTELKRTGNLSNSLTPYYITQLTNRVASAAHVEYHSRLIKQQYIRRELIKKGSDIANKACSDSVDVLELLADTEKSLSDITGSLSSKQIQHVSNVVVSVNEDRKKAGEETVMGVLSGIKELDEITGGWGKTDSIILAARPGMGKTGLAITWVINAAKNGIPVGLFSLEMSEKQIVNRMLAQEGGVSVTSIKRNKLSEKEKVKLDKASVVISGLPIYIDDTPSLSILELKAKARRLKRKHAIGLIIIDYMQLMTTGGKGSRDQEIGQISRALKGLAKELDIPIIPLSQVGREVEKKNKKHQRPTLSDLRESGSIEQDADIVIFIYRPEYYDKDACDEAGNSLKGVAELIVAKNRNGDTKTALCEFEAWTTRFLNREGTANDAGEEDMPF